MARGGWEPKGELAASCDSLVALGMRVVLVRRREMWKLRTLSQRSTIYCHTHRSLCGARCSLQETPGIEQTMKSDSTGSAR